MIRLAPNKMIHMTAIGLLLFVQFWVTRHLVEHENELKGQTLQIHSHGDHDHHHHHDPEDHSEGSHHSHSSDHHQLSFVHFQKKQIGMALPMVVARVQSELSPPILGQRDWLLPGETLTVRKEPRPPSQPRAPPLS